MKNEFVLAFNEIIEEKQLPKEVILAALEAAMASAYRKAENVSNAQHVEAKIDLQTGKVVIYAEKEVVEVVQDPRTEVSLEEARRVEPETEIGNMVIVETTPKDFGRVAAQTARQVIQQRIREAERDAQLEYYRHQVGEIVSGMIQSNNQQGLTLGLEMRAEGNMPRKEMIPGERYRVHERIRALLLEVKDNNKGPQIILSRAHRNFLRRLLENEVPEIYHGMVEIRSIAREPGQRSKVAVAALQAGVDPVGACVGMRGMRIQAIVRELNDEKIDVIEWNTDPAIFIAKSLSPARVIGVYLNDRNKVTKTATVVVPEDQLSLAIGRDGQNARLAARLTSWRIDIKSLSEAVTDALEKLNNDPDYATFAELEREIVPQIQHILGKKAEGRPITPEEYQLMGQFVDRIERGILRQRASDISAEEERQRIEAANIPDAAYEMPLEDLGLPLRYTNLLNGAGYLTVGDIMLQLKLDSNAVLGLEGIGAKAMSLIEEALANLPFAKSEEAVEEVTSEITESEIEIEEPAEMVAVTGDEVEVPDEEKVKEDEAQHEIEAEEVGKTIPSETIISAELEEQTAQIESERENVEEEVSVDEKQPSLEELFKWEPDKMVVDVIEDDDEKEEIDKTKKKKKTRKKYIEYEYDPEHEETILKKKRKRGSGEGWEGDWDV